MPSTDEVLNTYFATRDYRETADLLGLSYEAVRKRVKRNLPPGATTHIKNGAIVQQWLRSPKTPIQREDIIDGVRDALNDYKPPAPLKTALKGNKDLLGLLPLADLHMGMRAWNRETGGVDWDISIATKCYQAGIDSMASRMPKCKKIVVLLAGDLAHTDNFHQGTTNPNTHHIVDVDGRYPKVVRSAAHIAYHAIDRSLETADEVEVVCLPGNHDCATMAGVSESICQRYRNQRRVTVTNSDCPHWFAEWGVNMFAATHGDKLKQRRMGQYMADQAAEIWGRTKFRFGFLGHLHSKTITSEPGVQLEILPTPCAPDSFSSSHGYSSMRQFQAMWYCKKRGLRNTITELLV